MEYQHKLILLSAVLVAIALYVAVTAPRPDLPADAGAPEALLIKSANFGYGLESYTYAYSDVTDGYKTSYLLLAANNSRYIEITNPLSTKRVFMLENDTVFCIRYPINESCVSVHNNSEMQSYISFVQSKFFNDTNIMRSKSSMELLIGKGYLHAKPGIENASFGDFACSQVEYSIDYSNATVQDAALFGIGAQSPKIYNLTRCMDNESGLAYRTALSYEEGNVTHEKITAVTAFTKGAAQIPQAPEPSGDAIGVFTREREQQSKLAACHTGKQGEEREKCVSDIALGQRRKDLCELSGSRRDRCLVSLVPLTKDQAICATISSAAFKDDCFIELAGAYKNESYCASVLDESKLALCQMAAAPRGNNGTANESDSGTISGEPPPGNATDDADSSEIDVLGMLEYIDKHNDSGTAPDQVGNESGSAAE